MKEHTKQKTHYPSYNNAYTPSWQSSIEMHIEDP